MVVPPSPALVLALDIGNSSVTVALASGGIPGDLHRFPTARAAQGADALRVELERVLGTITAASRVDAAADPRNVPIGDPAALAHLDGIVLSSVVPAATDAVRALADLIGRPLLVADHATIPIPIRVERPEAVGPDRLVDAYAVGHLHRRRPAIVVDLGTATTVDAIGPDGAFLGGAIAPGLELGLDALAARTALLPRVELATPERAIGRTTADAIRAGTVLGYQALVGGLIERIRTELSTASGIAASAIPAIATGGLSAEPWIAGVAGLDGVDPRLTISGLVALWSDVGPGASGGSGGSPRRDRRATGRPGVGLSPTTTGVPT